MIETVEFPVNVKELSAIPAPLLAKPEPIVYPTDPRLARMRFLSMLLDNAILLPGGYRIGFDPIIGLLPGLGDFLGGLLSIWLIYDAARLGVSKLALLKMVLNVMIDTCAGSVPVLGDLMDAVWKSNARNMRLVEEEYRPGQKARSFRQIVAFICAIIALLFFALFAVFYVGIKLLIALFAWI